MKLLLDTHIWIWSLLKPGKLARRVLRALENPANELWLSPISIWELTILVEEGRVVLNAELEAWLAHAMRAAPLKEAPLTWEVALAAGNTGLPHRDPADAFLVATAKVFELTLVTADARLQAAKGIPLLPSW